MGILKNSKKSKGIPPRDRTTPNRSNNRFNIDEDSGQVLAISDPVNPWNALGIEFERKSRFNMVEALNLICPWEPQEKLIYAQLEDGTFYPISDYKAIIRDDVEPWINPHAGNRKELEVLQVASSTYEIVGNRECFLWAQPLMDEGLLELDAACVMDGGRRVIIACKTTSGAVANLDGRKDQIEMRVILATSHDSTLPIMIGKSLTRVQCWNFISSWLGDKKKDYIGIKHTLAASDRLDQAREYVASVIRDFRQETVPVYRKLREVELSAEGFKVYCEEVFKKQLAGREIEEYQPWKRLEAIYTSSPLMVGVPNSYYRGVQSVTEYLSQYAGGIDTRTQVASRFKNNLFGNNRLTQTRALEVAVSLSNVG